MAANFLELTSKAICEAQPLLYESSRKVDGNEHDAQRQTRRRFLPSRFLSSEERGPHFGNLDSRVPECQPSARLDSRRRSWIPNAENAAYYAHPQIPNAEPGELWGIGSRGSDISSISTLNKVACEPMPVRHTFLTPIPASIRRKNYNPTIDFQEKHLISPKNSLETFNNFNSNDIIGNFGIDFANEVSRLRQQRRRMDSTKDITREALEKNVTPYIDCSEKTVIYAILACLGSIVLYVINGEVTRHVQESLPPLKCPYFIIWFAHTFQFLLIFPALHLIFTDKNEEHPQNSEQSFISQLTGQFSDAENSNRCTDASLLSQSATPPTPCKYFSAANPIHDAAPANSLIINDNGATTNDNGSTTVPTTPPLASSCNLECKGKVRRTSDVDIQKQQNIVQESPNSDEITPTRFTVFPRAVNCCNCYQKHSHSESENISFTNCQLPCNDKQQRKYTFIAKLDMFVITCMKHTSFNSLFLKVFFLTLIYHVNAYLWALSLGTADMSLGTVTAVFNTNPIWVLVCSTCISFINGAKEDDLMRIVPPDEAENWGIAEHSVSPASSSDFCDTDFDTPEHHSGNLTPSTAATVTPSRGKFVSGEPVKMENNILTLECEREIENASTLQPPPRTFPVPRKDVRHPSSRRSRIIKQKVNQPIHGSNFQDGTYTSDNNSDLYTYVPVSKPLFSTLSSTEKNKCYSLQKKLFRCCTKDFLIQFLAISIAMTGVSILSFDARGTYGGVGILLALLSAFFYGFFEVRYKTEVLQNRSSAPISFVCLVVGLMGFVYICVLWPPILVLHSYTIESIDKTVTVSQWCLLCLNGVCITSFQLCLQLSLCFFPNPLLVSLASLLCTPAAQVTDWFLKTGFITPPTILGSCLIGISFVIMVFQETRKAEEAEEVIVAYNMDMYNPFCNANPDIIV